MLSLNHFSRLDMSFIALIWARSHAPICHLTMSSVIRFWGSTLMVFIKKNSVSHRCSSGQLDDGGVISWSGCLCFVYLFIQGPIDVFSQPKVGVTRTPSITKFGQFTLTQFVAMADWWTLDSLLASSWCDASSAFRVLLGLTPTECSGLQLTSSVVNQFSSILQGSITSPLVGC